jgi:glycosyltransferase involved in cell wall biosynthesis
LIVTYIHSSNPSVQKCVQTRCRNLVSAIRRTGWHKAHLLDLGTFVSNTSRAQEVCAESDLLVVHRFLYGPVIRMLQSWKARDKKVIVDIDEAVDRLPKESASYRFWMEGVPMDETAGECVEEGQLLDPLPIEQFRLGLRLADGVSVSSVRLADDWGAYSNVLHVPDYLNLDQYLTIKQFHPGEVWIGISLEGVSPAMLENTGLRAALEAVCRQREQVRLYWVGADAHNADGLDISLRQKIQMPTPTLEAWPRVLAGFDIGLAPALGETGMRAGWQRLLEYMVMKVPWIGSDLPSYRELSRFGWLVQNTPDAWERGLLEVVDHLEAYQAEAAGEPFLFALGQDVHENVAKILAGYASILYRS